MKDYQNWHPNFPVNLENCHEEPIHIPGAIQEFGVLIGFQQDTGEIQVCSENAAEVFPQLKNGGDKKILISDLLTIQDVSPSVESEKKRVLVYVQVQEQQFFGVRYESQGLQVLEIETKKKCQEFQKQARYLHDLPSMMRDIQTHPSVRQLVDFAAEKIKSLTGFDRVMIYKYDADWNGEVVAEAKEKHLETFLGLHYPASDVPPQARALYEKNWIRIIPTVNYKPVTLTPASWQNLDLSHSVLRSVSPIHIRYLRNMGVGASMSISLIIEGKLWGLVACHHYSEHYVPLDVRLGCEAYGQLISWHIKTLEASENLQKISEGEERLHRVLKSFSVDEDTAAAAKKSEDDLLKIFDCSGMVIRLGEETIHLGKNPGEVFSTAVARSLLNRNILDPLVSDEASMTLDIPPEAVSTDTCGFMALALSPKYNYYIICTRPEETQTINWAGNVEEKRKINFADPQQRLEPRGSFELWKQIHKNCSRAWAPESVDLLKRFALLFVKIVIERKELLDQSNTELKNLNQAKDEFVAMISHELRTPLNAIIGWTDLALSGELEEGKVLDALKIIQRNARSQNQLVADLLDVSRIISGKMKLSVRNMRVSEIAESVILSFTPAADAKMIQIIPLLDNKADSIIGDPSRIQQVMWNLLSNAVKFSSKNSKIWVSVSRSNSQVALEIRDQGMGIAKENLDKIFGRFQQVDSTISRRAGGLGLGLSISKHLVELHGGTIQVDSEGLGKGSVFRVLFPVSPILPQKKDDLMPIDDDFHSPQLDISAADKNLTGEVILIVEDETDAANFLNLLIKAHGAKTFVAHNGIQALEILDKHKLEIGIVLSDVGMPKMDGYELVKQIRQSSDPHIKSICAVALTAFGRPQDRIHALKMGFDSYIAKPVMQEELVTVLETVCKSRKRSLDT